MAHCTSHALRVRGLKHVFVYDQVGSRYVARSARAWIETGQL